MFGNNNPLIVPPKGKPAAKLVIDVDDKGRTEVRAIVYTPLGQELPMNPLAVVSLLLQVATPAIVNAQMMDAQSRAKNSGGLADGIEKIQ